MPGKEVQTTLFYKGHKYIVKGARDRDGSILVLGVWDSANLQVRREDCHDQLWKELINAIADALLRAGVTQ